MSAIQAGGICESCGREWTATVPLDRAPHVRCVCGHRHVVEFVHNGIPIVHCVSQGHYAAPSVN